jgi:hypothetical protein
VLFVADKINLHKSIASKLPTFTLASVLETHPMTQVIWPHTMVTLIGRDFMPSVDELYSQADTMRDEAAAERDKAAAATARARDLERAESGVRATAVAQERQEDAAAREAARASATQEGSNPRPII